MPGIPDDAVQQLGELPIVVAVLLISLIAVVAIVWIVMRLLGSTESSRRDERQARDGIFLAFIAEQRELDRTLGKQTADAFTRALAGLADSIRDNGTATLAVMNEIRAKVDDALNSQTDSIRETNYMLAKMGRDIDVLRASTVVEEDHEASDKKGKR
jgi:hypothetical protein